MAILKRSDLDADQEDAIDFINGGEDAFLAADVGTGKTVISLTAASESEPDMKWLVVAPLLVATDTWPKEPPQWQHLSSIDMAVACGDEKQRLRALQQDAQFTTINFENLAWLMDQYPKKHGKPDPLPFKGLIIDEVDKLKNVSTNRFKMIRNRIKHFDRRIGLTGTVLPNKLEEIWGQMYMVDNGEALGRSFYKWRQQYFYPIDFNQYQWKPFEHTRDLILEMLEGLVYRLEAKNLPTMLFDYPAVIEMPSEARAAYKLLEKQLFLLIKDFEQTDRIVDAQGAAALKGKLQQITAGFSYLDNTKDVHWHTKAKINWLKALSTQLCDQQLLVFYHFNAEQDALAERFPFMKFFGKGTTNKQALEYIDLWNAGEINRLALHPASAGHGLNLQKNHAHHAAFTTLPWSGGLFKQSVGRLARRGNKSEHVYVHTAGFENTIDFDVYSAVTGKLHELESFLDAIT